MKTQDHQDSRHNILRAAATLFAQQGFSGTSFAAVAKQAQQSKTLVQYHFENKDRLWKETVKYIWQQRDLALPNYLDESYFNTLDAHQQKQVLRQLCKRLIEFTIDNPEWVKIMYQEATIPGPRLDWMVETFFIDDVEQGQAMIRFVQSLGLLPQGDPLSLLCILAGSLIHYVNIASITSQVLQVDMLSDQQVDHYVNSFILLMEGAMTAPQLETNSL